jgi:hypothetical protein
MGLEGHVGGLLFAYRDERTRAWELVRQCRLLRAAGRWPAARYLLEQLTGCLQRLSHLASQLGNDDGNDAHRAMEADQLIAAARDLTLSIPA